MIVAIPSIDRSFHLTTANLAWVINAYSLTFGGLMLVAGRIGDVLGRKNVFPLRPGAVRPGLPARWTGTTSGNRPDPLPCPTRHRRRDRHTGCPVAAGHHVPEGQPRTKALGLYGAMTGMASVMGLLLGGVLTPMAGWRWVLFVNVPIAIGLIVGVGVLSEGQLDRVRIDLPGVITATLGVGALVFAVNRVGEHGWTDGIVIACLVAAVVLLIGFVAIQRASRAPMIPHGVLNERGRAGANIITFVTSAACSPRTTSSPSTCNRF